MIQTRLCLCLYLVMFVTEATLICLASNVLAQNLGGQITRLEGTADVRLPGAASTPAKVNMPIEYREQLTTHLKSQVEITLPPQTTLVTWPTSIVLFDRSLVRLFRGSVEAHVLPPNPTHFLTGNGEIVVRGTLFDITYTEGIVRPGYGGCRRYTDVVVREGVVAVNNLANPAAVIEVPAGYETTIACLQPPLAPGPIGLTGALSASSAAGAGAPVGPLAVPFPPPSSVAPAPVPAFKQ